MTTYVHLRRYGKKTSAGESAVDVLGDGQVVFRGYRYDLRAGDKTTKQAGFAHHLDGRYLEWTGDGWTLVVHHPDGRVVTVDVHGGTPVRLVGPFLVHADDARKPWLVFDAATGQPVGRIEDQRGDVVGDTLMYTPQWFDPKNDRTLWLCEGSRLAELDVAQRRMARTIEAPADHSFMRVAALVDGHVITSVRTLENKARHNRSADRIALYSTAGELVREMPGDIVDLSALGDRFIISDDRKRQFVIFDRMLEPVAAVPMHEPLRDGFNLIAALPSGREWIGNRLNGEWDHYGEPDLAPSGPVTAPKPKKPTKKPAKK